MECHKLQLLAFPQPLKTMLTGCVKTGNRLYYGVNQNVFPRLVSCTPGPHLVGPSRETVEALEGDSWLIETVNGSKLEGRGLALHLLLLSAFWSICPVKNYVLCFCHNRSICSLPSHDGLHLWKSEPRSPPPPYTHTLEMTCVSYFVTETRGGANSKDIWLMSSVFTRP